MIISHSHKFIFVKSPKIGGTSIVEYLEPYLDEDLRNRDRGDHEQFNEIINIVPNYQEYFKFGFVRNPWDMRLSRYFYLIQKEIPKHKKLGKPYREEVLSYKSFNDYCKNEPWFPSKNQIDFLSNNLNFYGKYESLQDDFDTICNKINIPKQKLPHNNKSKHKHYTEYYDNHTIKLVAEKHAKDIRYFGYKFGE